MSAGARPLRAVAAALLFLAVAAPAAAAFEFNGFYAGVNADYARGVGPGARGSDLLPPPPSSEPDPALPRSAAAAAERMRRAGAPSGGDPRR